MAKTYTRPCPASRFKRTCVGTNGFIRRNESINSICEDIAEPEETTPVSRSSEDIADDILAEDNHRRKTAKIVDWLSNCGINCFA